MLTRTLSAALAIVMATAAHASPRHGAPSAQLQAAGVTYYRTRAADGRGALVVVAGACTVIIYSGVTRETPPDTETTGACNLQQIARRIAK